MDAYADPTDDTSFNDEFGTLTPQITIGYLVRVTPELVALATDYDPSEDSYRGATTIPLGWVVFARLLNPPTLLTSKLYSRYQEEFTNAPSEGNLPKSDRPEHRRTRKIRPSEEAGHRNRPRHSPSLGSPNPQKEEEVA